MSHVINDSNGGEVLSNANVLSDYNLSALMDQKKGKARLRELQKHVDVSANKRSTSN